MSVSNEVQGRMLLSHNFDVSPDIVPALSREEFAAVLEAGLRAYPQSQCRLVNHPHWTVEIRFPTDQFSPLQVGELCANALAEKRRSRFAGSASLSQHLNAATFPELLVLGGIKTTPPTSNSPDALQPGDWGVDVVETRSGQDFLQAIGWEATIAQKPADSVFKVELKGY